jgi:starvation-inducible DNA-binding protein
MTNTSLSPQDQKVTGQALQSALTGLINLGLQAKQAHWNLTGPNFRPVHLHLDEVVETVREHADTVAERAVAIGVPADGRPKTVAKEGGAEQFGAQPIPDREVVAGMTQLLGVVIGKLRDGIKETGDADPVSQDLLIQAAGDLEKHRWMFAAQQ